MLSLRLFGQAELRTDDDHEPRAVLAQPKRLALLAYLAAARPIGFHRRDTLLGLFWPELDQERGRAALRQALYTLRQALGPDTLSTRGDSEIAINPEALTCDVVQFRSRLENDPAGAVDLYHGDLLNGFFLQEAPEFERWLEEERWLLRREAAAAAWREAERLRAADVDAAANWAARAAALDPFNEAAVRRLMRLLAQGGHRAHALRIYQTFARLLERELDTAPSEETRELAASLRSTPVISPELAHPTLELAPLPRLRRSRARIALAVFVVAVVAGLGVYYQLQLDRRAHATIAVGEILSGEPGQAAALRDMLATSIARIEGAHVVSNTRLLELTHGAQSGAALARAARSANVQRLLQGTVYRDGTGGLRLSLAWVDMRSGEEHPAADVLEKDEFALVDAATAEIAHALALAAPVARFASVTTTSLPAYRAYEQGVRALYAEERTTATRLLLQAVQADSNFAMAWWYLSRATTTNPDGIECAARAMRLARHASDRERLFITASYLKEMEDPARLAVAETLAIRYPTEPEGPYLLGYARMWSGDFMGAIPDFERAAQMDSASVHELGSARCTACDALSEIGTALALADSGAALLRYANRWIRLAPIWRGGWMHQVIALEMLGRYPEAVRAREHMNAIPPANYRDINLAETYMRAGDFAAADALLLDRIRNGDPDMKSDALYKYSLSLRNQKRFAEALQAARAYRALEHGDWRGRLYGGIPQMWALLDLGRAREAAALADSIARPPYTTVSTARNARAFASAYARSAEAAFAARDTVRLGELIDTIAYWGGRTAFGPARALHHHARGLLLSLRSDHAGAVREFQAALFSPTNGWTRTNYHLAQELLAVGRARAAARVAEAGLRGIVGGAAYSLTHRELHEIAEAAWTRAGVLDSSRVHENWLKKLSSSP